MRGQRAAPRGRLLLLLAMPPLLLLLMLARATAHLRADDDSFEPRTSLGENHAESNFSPLATEMSRLSTEAGGLCCTPHMPTARAREHIFLLLLLVR